MLADAIALCALTTVAWPQAPGDPGQQDGQGFRPIVTSGPIQVLAPEANAALAAEAWAAVTDRADPLLLDDFVRRFPESDEAVEAFSLRFQGVRAARSIAGYHRFIATYPRRAAVPVAIGELFALYRKQDRFSGYVDFVRRYPNTPEAVVARMHAEELAFELVTLLGTVEAYDGFLLAFPAAPQAQAAAELARKELLAQHRAAHAAKEAELSPSELEAWVNRTLRSMRFTYRDLWTAIEEDEPSPQTFEFLEREVLGYRPESITPELRLNLADRLERIYYVVRWMPAYRTAEASDSILAEVRHQELIAKLEEIRVTLIASRDEMVRVLREEMAATRETLRDGFDLLVEQHRLDRRTLERGVQRLQTSMEVLHRDLGLVQGELRDIHGTLADLDTGIRETNARLARLDRRLYEMHGSLVALHHDMNVGFDGVQQRIAVLNHDLNQGFARQHEIAYAQLDVAQASLWVQEAQLEVQTETMYLTEQLVDVQIESLYAQYESINLQYDSIELQLETLNELQYGFETLDYTMQSGFTRIEDATWGAASMVADSNRQMVASLQRQQRHESSGNFFESTLGTLGAFAPGVGPIVGSIGGAVIGDALDRAIAGESIDPLAMGRTAVVAGVGTRFGAKVPFAGDMAGLAYDAAVVERRGNYELAGQVFGHGARAQTAWRDLNEKASTAEDFVRVSQAMGASFGVNPQAIQFAVEKIF